LEISLQALEIIKVSKKAMAKMKRLTKKQIFPEWPQRCDFCTRALENQDAYIKHLLIHVRRLALKLQLVL